ncbi:nitroreductase/quinone reductase family protein [Nocardia sp. NPDC050712]|uniref:nitroreductase/quinone reductase family protein n=1 Tax=Nocardia sp. NPDC050712 TaxID=3155518 RepID=UPI0033E4DD0A
MSEVDMVENHPTEISLSGRLANFGSTRLTGVSKLSGRVHQYVYQRFGGTRFGKWMGKPVFELTVPGRKTGEPRSVILMLVRDGDDLLVCGSFGGRPTAPAWWHNLVAAGNGTVRIGRDTFPVTARVITDPAEHATHWRTLVAGYPDFDTYQALSPRKLPIAVLSRAA